MDLQILTRTEELLERAGKAGVTVELLDNGKLRMRRWHSGGHEPEVVAELRARRDEVATVLAIPRPSAEQELERDENGWITLNHAIGACVACDEPCRSWDAEDHPRHWNCRPAEAAA